MNKLQTLKTSLSPRQRAILLAVMVVLVFGLLCATVFRDQAATVFRRITYSQGQDDFAHNAQSNSLFLGLRDNLLVCTQTQIQVFSPSGTPHLKEAVSMASPALNAAGKYAVVYDVGGQQLRVVAGEELIHELELPAEESFISATVNDKGWVATTTKVSGYKAVVTVYNPSLESVLAIRLSSRYISDAVVTPDCRGVYLISPGQAGGAFENTLLYYTFSSREKPTREVSLGSNVVLSLLSRGQCWVLGDKSLLLLDSSGVITASYHYDGQYLKMGSLHGDDFASLFLTRSASGSTGTLVTVDDDGKELGRLTIDGQTQALAAQGKEIAVLTTSEIITTNHKLSYSIHEPNQRGIRNLAIYDDGSVALVSSATVSLYFPTGTKVENLSPEELEALTETEAPAPEAAETTPSAETPQREEAVP